jgi:single-stranded DNA-specific DHH superfamily exonuclease
VIIDHHLYEKNLNSERVLHINPRFSSEAYIPASAVVYEALKSMGKKVEPLLWIAAIGVIGDYGFEDCKDLVDDSRQKYPKLLGKGQSPLESKFWSAAELISAAVTLNSNSGARKCLGFMLKSKNFEEFVSVPELGGWKREVDEEFDKVVRRLEQKKEEHPNGILTFEISTKLGLNSAVAGHFSEKYPDSVTIIRRNVGKGKDQQWKLSIRCQSGRVNVGEVSKSAVKGIGSGGGHVKAAGAMVNDWDRFVKRFVRLAGQAK